MFVQVLKIKYKFRHYQMSKSMNGWIDVYVPLLKYFDNRGECVRIIGRIL